MLDSLLDVFRLKQYFDVITIGREFLQGVRSDARFVHATRRAAVRLPSDRWAPVPTPVFAPMAPFPVGSARGGRRVGIVATGGSGSLASVVGIGRAFEDAGLQPAVISVCSGSAMFGFPLAAGIPAEEVAQFTAGLRPEDYVDPDWRRFATLIPHVGRGFAGLLRGERLEATYRRLLGDRRLGDLQVPCYAPIWNIEHNRVEYLGPSTYPDVTIAHAVRMAVALPLFFDPVRLAGGAWCDGGIVDIFPVLPVLDLEPPPDAVVAVNGFYPPGFTGEDASGWSDRSWSILHVASQVRTCQQAQLARENLRQLKDVCPVAMIEPVPYEKVKGVGFYRQFLDPSEWPTFMRTARADARGALTRLLTTDREAPRVRSSAVVDKRDTALPVTESA